MENVHATLQGWRCKGIRLTIENGGLRYRAQTPPDGFIPELRAKKDAILQWTAWKDAIGETQSQLIERWQTAYTHDWVPIQSLFDFFQARIETSGLTPIQTLNRILDTLELHEVIEWDGDVSVKLSGR